MNIYAFFCYTCSPFSHSWVHGPSGLVTSNPNSNLNQTWNSDFHFELSVLLNWLRKPMFCQMIVQLKHGQTFVKNLLNFFWKQKKNKTIRPIFHDNRSVVRVSQVSNFFFLFFFYQFLWRQITRLNFLLKKQNETFFVIHLKFTGSLFY